MNVNSKEDNNFKILAENIPDVISRFDREYRHIYINSAVEKEFGIPQNAFPGKSHREVGFLPEKAECIEDIIRRIFETGKEIDFELNHPVYGKKKYFISRGVPEFADDGSVKSVLMIHRDITERKQKEETLKEANAKFQLLIDKSKDVIWTQDLNLQITYMSSNVENLLGYTVDEYRNLPGNVRLPAESVSLIKNKLTETLQKIKNGEIDITTYSFKAELLHRHKNGELIWGEANCSFIYDDNNTITGIHGITRDINSRKKADQILLDTQIRLNNIIELTNVGTWDWDMRTGETIFNERWAEMAGYTLEELSPVSPLTWIELIHPDDMETFSSQFKEVYEKKLPIYEIDCRMKHRDGGWIWIINRGKVTGCDMDGKPVRMTGTHMNITKRKQSEEALLMAEQFLHSTIDALSSRIAICDGTGDILMVNRAWAESGNSIGLPAIDYCEGANYLTICDSAAAKGNYDAMKAAHVFRQISEGVFPSAMIEYSSGTSGEKEWFHVHFNIFENNQIMNIVISQNNITERKKAEKELFELNNSLENQITERVKELNITIRALYESDEKYRTVAEFTYDWEYWIDKNGRFIYNSPSCERITGYHPDLFINNPEFLNSIVHPDDQEMVIRNIAEINKYIDIISFEFRLISRGGNILWLAHKSFPVYDKSGRWTGRRASNRDITENIEREKEILRLNKNIIDVQEKERQRIARDLHDSVSQTITAAKLNFESFKYNTADFKNRYEIGMKFLDNASSELREIYTDLYPSILKDLGLVATIQWYARHHLEYNGIEVTLLLSLQISLTDEIQVNIYRIIQEIFSNINRHAKASEVKVSLFNDEAVVYLEVLDNGIGFPEKKPYRKKTGYGLLNVAQRVHNMNGTIKISSPGDASKISINFPIGG